MLDDLRHNGWRNIIVVNDGSRDRTAEVAHKKGAAVISHKRNGGLGAALRTGLNEALKRGADCAVTFDADRQHDPKAIARVVDALENADLVIGQRHFVGAPSHKRFGNFWLNMITRMMGGILTDSQSGMRAFNRRALKTIHIRSNRYEVSSEIIVQAHQKKLGIEEVQVNCFFTPYSKARGTNIASGIRIFIGLVKLRLSGF